MSANLQHIIQHNWTAELSEDWTQALEHLDRIHGRLGSDTGTLFHALLFDRYPPNTGELALKEVKHAVEHWTAHSVQAEEKIAETDYSDGEEEFLGDYADTMIVPAVKPSTLSNKSATGGKRPMADTAPVVKPTTSTIKAGNGGKRPMDDPPLLVAHDKKPKPSPKPSPKASVVNPLPVKSVVKEAKNTIKTPGGTSPKTTPKTTDAGLSSRRTASSGKDFLARLDPTIR